jgi:hypothetical protein
MKNTKKSNQPAPKKDNSIIFKLMTSMTFITSVIDMLREFIL